MRALITGGAGFVGRALAAHLVAAGDRVIATDRSSGGPDITDREGMFDFVSSHDVDVVYHLAAQSRVPTSWADPVGTLRTNVEGTQNACDAAFEAGVGRLLAITSAEVYGQVEPDDLPLDEDQPLRPVTPYASSKVGADAVALQSFLGRGQDVIRLRAFNHIGPGQSDVFVAAGLASRVARAERDGASEMAVGNLTPRRDFTDVRDVVRAYRLVAESGVAGSVYNVCSGVDRSIRELADGLLSYARCDLALVPDPDLVRPVDVPVLRGDNGRLKRDTGWEPLIAFDRSLGDVLDDARSRLDG